MHWWYWSLLALAIGYGILLPGIGSKVAEATELGLPWWRGVMPGVGLIAIVWVPAFAVALFLIYVVKMQ